MAKVKVHGAESLIKTHKITIAMHNEVTGWYRVCTFKSLVDAAGKGMGGINFLLYLLGDFNTVQPTVAIAAISGLNNDNAVYGSVLSCYGGYPTAIRVRKVLDSKNYSLEAQFRQSGNIGLKSFILSGFFDIVDDANWQTPELVTDDAPILLTLTMANSAVSSDLPDIDGPTMEEDTPMDENTIMGGYSEVVVSLLPALVGGARHG